jgi:hypothetical protein
MENLSLSTDYSSDERHVEESGELPKNDVVKGVALFWTSAQIQESGGAAGYRAESKIRFSLNARPIAAAAKSKSRVRAPDFGALSVHYRLQMRFPAANESSLNR